MLPPYAPGDHIRVCRGPYWHHGIYFGEGWVIHLSGVVGGKNEATVQWCRFQEFVGSNGLEAVKAVPYGRCDPVHVVLARAQSQVGRTGYNVIRDNCEHFSYWCKTGRTKSGQVDAVTAAGVGVGGGAGATAAALSAVAAGGTVVGTSGPGIMSGLAAAGGLVGGGAAAGVAVLAAAPSTLAMLGLRHAYRDDEALPEADREARAKARAVGTLGAAGATFATIGAISAAGVPGLSAAGISSGLAAIGGTMLGGVAVTIAAPAAIALTVAWLAYRLGRR